MKNTNIIEKSKAHFDATARNYDASSDGQFTEKMYAPLVAELRKSSSGKLLDVGCGNGNTLVPLMDTPLTLFGLDLSDEMIEEAKKRLSSRAELSVGNAEALPYGDNVFDIVVCNASFHHYPKPDAVLEEMHRVMKPGAILYIGESFVPQPGRFFMNLFIRFSADGDFHIYGQKELTQMLAQHGFAMRQVTKTAEHAVLYTAVKNA